MPEHQKEREVPKPVVEKPIVKDIPYIVGETIAAVMRDRGSMPAMNNALDNYLSTLSSEQKQETKQLVKDQLTNGRLALESLYARYLQSVG